MSPRGTIYSYTVSYTVMMNLPGWSKDLPVVVGIIDLDDGGRLYAQITDCDADEVAIGSVVIAHFEPIADGISIPKFKLAS